MIEKELRNLYISDLANDISESTGVSKRGTQKVISTLIETIINTVQINGDIQITNLGKFIKKTINSDETVEFRPSKNFINIMNQKE